MKTKVSKLFVRLKISCFLRLSRIILKLDSFFAKQKIQETSFDFIWNLRKSNVFDPESRVPYLDIHNGWDKAGNLWENGQYYEAVELRKKIMHRVYHEAGVNTPGYAPPIMEEWWTTRIGHLAVLGVFSIAQDLGLLPSQKRYLLNSSEVGNFELRSVLASNFTTIESHGKPSFTQIAQFWPLCEKMQLIRTQNDFIDQYQLWELVFQKINGKDDYNHQKLFRLSEEYVEKSIRELRSLGKFNQKKFVTLHIRGSRNWKDRRSQEPDTYIPTIKYLLENEYTVVRIGDSTMQSLPEEAGFLDLTRLEQGGSHLHAFLLSNCGFMIGTTSGPSWIPALFKKPVLMTNTTSIGKIMLSTSPHSIYLPKRIFEKGKEWSLSKVLQSRHAFSESSFKQLDKEGIELRDNSATEILEATKDMIRNHELGEPNDFVGLNASVRQLQDEYLSIGKGVFAPSFLEENANTFVK